jgi:hypothetical protein
MGAATKLATAVIYGRKILLQNWAEAAADEGNLATVRGTGTKVN